MLKRVAHQEQNEKGPQNFSPNRRIMWRNEQGSQQWTQGGKKFRETYPYMY